MVLSFFDPISDDEEEEDEQMRRRREEEEKMRERLKKIQGQKFEDTERILERRIGLLRSSGGILKKDMASFLEKAHVKRAIAQVAENSRRELGEGVGLKALDAWLRALAERVLDGSQTLKADGERAMSLDEAQRVGGELRRLCQQALLLGAQDDDIQDMHNPFAVLIAEERKRRADESEKRLRCEHAIAAEHWEKISKEYEEKKRAKKAAEEARVKAEEEACLEYMRLFEQQHSDGTLISVDALTRELQLMCHVVERVDPEDVEIQKQLQDMGVSEDDPQPIYDDRPYEQVIDRVDLPDSSELNDGSTFEETASNRKRSLSSCALDDAESMDAEVAPEPKKTVLNDSISTLDRKPTAELETDRCPQWTPTTVMTCGPSILKKRDEFYQRLQDVPLSNLPDELRSQVRQMRELMAKRRVHFVNAGLNDLFRKRDVHFWSGEGEEMSTNKAMYFWSSNSLLNGVDDGYTEVKEVFPLKVHTERKTKAIMRRGIQDVRNVRNDRRAVGYGALYTHRMNPPPVNFVDDRNRQNGGLEGYTLPFTVRRYQGGAFVSQVLSPEDLAMRAEKAWKSAIPSVPLSAALHPSQKRCESNTILALSDELLSWVATDKQSKESMEVATKWSNMAVSLYLTDADFSNAYKMVGNLSVDEMRWRCVLFAWGTMSIARHRLHARIPDGEVDKEGVADALKTIMLSVTRLNEAYIRKWKQMTQEHYKIEPLPVLGIVTIPEISDFGHEYAVLNFSIRKFVVEWNIIRSNGHESSMLPLKLVDWAQEVVDAARSAPAVLTYSSNGVEMRGRCFAKIARQEIGLHWRRCADEALDDYWIAAVFPTVLPAEAPSMNFPQINSYDDPLEGAVLGIADLFTRLVIVHPCTVLRRQCQVHQAAHYLHLTPFTLVPVVCNLVANDGLLTLWKGGLGTGVLWGMASLSEVVISEIFNLPRTIVPNGSTEKFWRHVLLKTATAFVMTPFYVSSFIETIRSESGGSEGHMFDVVLRGVDRLRGDLFGARGPASRRFSVLYLALPTVVFRTSHFLLANALYEYWFRVARRYVNKKPESERTRFHKFLPALFASMTSQVLTDLALYPFETVLHRLYVQGTRTLIDNLDNGTTALSITARYNGFSDCFRSIVKNEGVCALFAGVGSLALQYLLHSLLQKLINVCFDRGTAVMGPAHSPPLLAPAAGSSLPRPLASPNSSPSKPATSPRSGEYPTFGETTTSLDNYSFPPAFTSRPFGQPSTSSSFPKPAVDLPPLFLDTAREDNFRGFTD